MFLGLYATINNYVYNFVTGLKQEKVLQINGVVKPKTTLHVAICYKISI